MCDSKPPARMAEMDSMVAARDAEIAELNAKVQSAGDLLAIIHRDGGQYTDAYGWKKSCEDAIEWRHKVQPVVDAAVKVKQSWGEIVRNDQANDALDAAIDAYLAATDAKGGG